MNSHGTLEWNIEDLARALIIKPLEVREYFTDGRRVSFILERRIAYEVLQGSVSSSESSTFDVYDKAGAKWEIRSLTRSGVYFCPSYMVGSGREFEEQGFLDKISGITGYVVSDIEAFPQVPYWKIPASQVLRWWQAGALGKSSKVSREAALQLFAAIPS